MTKDLHKERSFLKPLDDEDWSSLVGKSVVKIANKGIELNQSSESSSRELELPEDIAGILTALSQAKGISRQEALRRVVAAAVYMYEAQEKGGKIFIQKPDKSIREISFQ